MSVAILTDLLLEHLPLFEHQTVRLGNDRDDVDDLAQLLHDNNINRAERVACGVDEKETAVNTRVLDVAVTHGGELFAEVGTVLVFDVFHNGIPATRQYKSDIRASAEFIWAEHTSSRC